MYVVKSQLVEMFQTLFLGQYLSLDTDHNGMLSKEELQRCPFSYFLHSQITFNLVLHRYRTGTLTKVFVDRVFQECLTYEGEMVSLVLILPLFFG